MNWAADGAGAGIRSLGCPNAIVRRSRRVCMYQQTESLYFLTCSHTAISHDACSCDRFGSGTCSNRRLSHGVARRSVLPSEHLARELGAWYRSGVDSLRLQNALKGAQTAATGQLFDRKPCFQASKLPHVARRRTAIKTWNFVHFIAVGRSPTHVQFLWGHL